MNLVSSLLVSFFKAFGAIAPRDACIGLKFTLLQADSDRAKNSPSQVGAQRDLKSGTGCCGKLNEFPWAKIQLGIIALMSDLSGCTS